jgi:Zn-dependent protease with chaperone function
MKPSEYKARLQQNNKANTHIPEIPKYQQVTKQLWDALQGDTVWAIMRFLGLDKIDDQQLRAQMEGHSFRVNQKVTPHLYNLFYGVKEKLNFEHPVDFYVTSDSSLNACAYTYQPKNPDSPYIVKVNSAMIETMTDAELCSVVGHELGHLLDENLVLSKIIGFLFPQCDEYGFPIMPVPLRYKYFFWMQLSELLADRYGYLATEDINACISSEFKLKSGLKLDKMDVDISAFIEENRESMQHFISGQGLSINNASHPVSPIRIEALNLFANAKTEKELNEGMEVVVEAIARMNSNEIGQNLLWFVGSAGLIMAHADGEMTHDELENILNHMSEFYMFPLDILQQITSENCNDIFNNSLQRLMELMPQSRNDLFSYLVNIMVTDYKFKKEELDLLVDMGKKAFGFDDETIMRLMADGIRIGVSKGFLPSTSSIS